MIKILCYNPAYQTWTWAQVTTSTAILIAQGRLPSLDVYRVRPLILATLWLPTTLSPDLFAGSLRN